MSAAAPVALPASVGMPGRPLCSHRPAPRASPIPGASPSPAIARYCRRPRQPGRCSPAKAAACAALSRPGAVPPQRAAACAAPLSSGRCSSPRHRAGCSAQAGRAGFYPRRAPPRPGAVPPQRPPPAPRLSRPGAAHPPSIAQDAVRRQVALDLIRAALLPGQALFPRKGRRLRRPLPAGRCAPAKGRRLRRASLVRALLIPPPSRRMQCAGRSRWILSAPRSSPAGRCSPAKAAACAALSRPAAAPSPAIAQDAVRRKVTLDFTHAARSGHVRGSSGRAARFSRHAGPPVLPAPRRKIGPLHRCARLSAGKISLHGSVQRAIIVFASGRGAIPHRRSQSANRSRCRLRPNR